MVILVIVNFEQLNADWVVSGRIARAFSWSGATRPTTLGIFKAFDRVWHAGLPKFFSKSYETLGQFFALISSLFAKSRLQVVLFGNSSQEYPVKVVATGI